MYFFYVFFKIHTKSGAQIGDFRTGGCHPLLKIDGWHATRATRSYEGPVVGVTPGVPGAPEPRMYPRSGYFLVNH